MTTVQFTGVRTGKTELMVPGHGLIHAGDIIEVPEGVAAAWTTLHPTADPSVRAADFSYATAVPLEDMTDADVTPADTEEAERPADPADNQSAADSAESEETL